MNQAKSFKKLRLHIETLRSVSTEVVLVTGGSSGHACTVLSTCSPECCDTTKARA